MDEGYGGTEGEVLPLNKMGVWGYLWLLVPVFDGWSGPQGRVGSTAYLCIGPDETVYVGEGRRLWRFCAGRWEEQWYLAGEGRAAAIDSQGRCWVVGLSVIYQADASQRRSIALPRLGWGERVWALNQGLAIRGAGASYWLCWSRLDSVVELPGVLHAAAETGLVVQVRDSLLEGFPGRWRFRARLPKGIRRVAQVASTLYLLSEDGGIWEPEQGLIRWVEGARLLAGPYVITENRVYEILTGQEIWAGAILVYQATWQESQGVLWLLTSTGLIAVYAKAGLGWVWQPGWALMAWKRSHGHVVAWQGARAFCFTRGQEVRYPHTLIDATWCDGRWVWATTKGLLSEDGRLLAGEGYYIRAVAASKQKLAWVIGNEVYLREASTGERRFGFPIAIMGVGWQGEQLWVWGYKQAYVYERGRWRGYAFAMPVEGRVWSDAVYFQQGRWWLRPHGRGWDTLREPPWLQAALPVSNEWGTLLASWEEGPVLYLLLSRGLLRVDRTQLHLPPLRFSATVQGPALEKLGGNKYRLPLTRPYLTLSYEVEAYFLPAYVQVSYRAGDRPLQPLRERTLLLSVGQAGSFPIEVWVRHPWYGKAISKQWVIQVEPPWYQTWYARLGFGLVGLAVLGGLWWLREWHHRQLRRRLQAEREALARQVQAQQGQLLQSERMANLGVMAAHIAHEINTPLGVISSGLEEALRRLPELKPAVPMPAQPPSTPAEERVLRQQWQEVSPDWSPLLIQQLAALGYTPAQKRELEPYLVSPEAMHRLRLAGELEAYLQRAREAAQRLRERVQAIRSYVRDIREDQATQRVDLRDSLQRTLSFYQPLLRRVALETVWPSEPLIVEAHAGRLDQVWANLLQNALQALPTDGGKLAIRLFREGALAIVHFQDNGHGIPPEWRERIFEPLFTTKAPGEGTGLGLPLCRQIIESYGGWIRLLHSEPGYTLFGVGLPLA